ncbi:MAG: alpha/beta fold hydrolase [Eubacterium sp.]|nr:alpha/beta fold hydrolase [Eubacterium sp.]
MRRDFTYPSQDDRTTIHAIEWVPEGEVKAVLQIVHGMVEFIGRYDRFATFLAKNGFYVVGNDHLGHGASVVSDDRHGYFADPDGNECVIGDMRTLMEMTKEKYPAVPYFILGHSMGSFLTRQFIEIHGAKLSGAIIMGTGYQSEGTLKAAMSIAKIAARFHGWDYRSKLLDNMALGSYNKKFEPARTPNDWLTRDEKIVDAYCANPWNNFRFTVNGYYHLFRGLEYAEKAENIAKIPKELPILVTSGGSDPVGNCGEGPKKVAEIYRNAGIGDVTLRLYPGDRHEILNELDHDLVDGEILAWLQAHM